jgi:hypothetical protein
VGCPLHACLVVSFMLPAVSIVHLTETHDVTAHATRCNPDGCVLCMHCGLHGLILTKSGLPHSLRAPSSPPWSSSWWLLLPPSSPSSPRTPPQLLGSLIGLVWLTREATPVLHHSTTLPHYVTCYTIGT